jgi:hypothetical protein
VKNDGFAKGRKLYNYKLVHKFKKILLIGALLISDFFSQQTIILLRDNLCLSTLTDLFLLCSLVNILYNFLTRPS